MMSDRGCTHLDAIESIKQPQRRECELGSSADLPDMWSHALLRQLAKPSRNQACARERASGDRIRAAR